MSEPIAAPPRGLFITGVDTGVGKTAVAAAIASELTEAGIQVGVYKPVASGAVPVDSPAARQLWDDWKCPGELPSNGWLAEDAVRLWTAAGCPGPLERVCPQQFAAPLAPHLAARAAGEAVDPALLRDGLTRWQGECDLVLVEGAGGLFSPISDEDYVADLAWEFGYPLIVVAANRIGVINQTLQTLIAAATVGSSQPGGDLQVAGVVLSQADDPHGTDDPSVASNPAELSARCVAPLLGELPWQATRVTPRGSPIGWRQLASPER